MRSSWQDAYPRADFRTELTIPQLTVPSKPFTATVSLANGSARPWNTAAVTLRVPAGWTVQATTATAAGQLAPGARLTATWQVTPPAGAPAATPWTLTAEGTALAPGGPVRYAADGTVTTPPPAPTKDGYLSDLPWIRAVNGWGPVERDSSNGKNAATPIAFGGTTYPKGLGVHAYSDVPFHLGGVAKRFTALVGIDDFSARQSSTGATRATVYGDDRVLLTTPTLTAATGPVPLDVDVRRRPRPPPGGDGRQRPHVLRPHVLGPGPRHGRLRAPRASGQPSKPTVPSGRIASTRAPCSTVRLTVQNFSCVRRTARAKTSSARGLLSGSSNS